MGFAQNRLCREISLMSLFGFNMVMGQNPFKPYLSLFKGESCCYFKNGTLKIIQTTMTHLAIPGLSQMVFFQNTQKGTGFLPNKNSS